MNSFIPDELLTKKENDILKEQFTQIIKSQPIDKINLKGFVYGIHETKNGKREIMDLKNNHIVLTGRRWLMQRAIGGSLPETYGQSDWTINWFGVGTGGANSSDPLTPLYTPDQQKELIQPIKILNIYDDNYKYCDNGYKKSFLQIDNKYNAQLRYDELNSEVLAVFHLLIDFNDCPYQLPNFGSKINELALYASPTNLVSETEFVMFSRYCMPTKYKSSDDKYTFLWYICF